MNQRVIKLATASNSNGAIVITLPPTGLVAPPGWCAFARAFKISGG
jgi:hypothetical protein